MKNRSMKKFLRHLRNNRVIELYESFFDSVLDLKELLNIKEEEIEKIIFYDEVSTTIRLYEIINRVVISEEIKNYILNLDNKLLIKYALRIAISNSFSDEEMKLKYIRIICESQNIESVKYACAVALNEKVNNDKNGFEYVRIVGDSDKKIAILIRDLLFENDFLEREDNFDFIKMLSSTNEDYIGECMVDLYGKVPIERLNILLCCKGIEQAKCTHSVLCNKKVMEREDGLLIALSIATREEGYESQRGLLATMNEEIMEREDAVALIFEVVTKNFIDKESCIECNFEKILESRDLDAIIKSLATISEEEQVTGNTKVKIIK